MMRRGPLAQYPAEWVLRQASANDASGSIEFHTDHPLTLYLRSGQVCHGVEGVAASGFATDPTLEADADEGAARTRVVRLLAEAMRAADGWYYLDPIGHHDITSPWQWDAGGLIGDARRPAAPATPSPAPAPTTATTATPAPVVAAPPADRVVRLKATTTDAPITLSAESWRLVCELATTRTAGELRRVLGWEPARLDAALAELARNHVLDVPVVAPGGLGPASLRTSPTAPAPLAASADRRGALRRLISSLKPA